MRLGLGEFGAVVDAEHAFEAGLGRDDRQALARRAISTMSVR